MRENMKPYKGEHGTLPHDHSLGRYPCYGGATHGRVGYAYGCFIKIHIAPCIYAGDHIRHAHLVCTSDIYTHISEMVSRHEWYGEGGSPTHAKQILF